MRSGSDLETQSKCNSPPDPLICEWQLLEGGSPRCDTVSCYNFQNESECISFSKLDCVWENERCREDREIVAVRGDELACMIMESLS